MACSNLPRGPRFDVLDSWSFIHRPRRYYAGLRRRFGSIVTLHTARAPLVMTLTSEGARQVFGANPEGFGAFQKDAFAGLAGQGSLWVLEGERHRRERRLLSPPFHAACVRGYGQAMQEIALWYVDRWQPGQSIRAYDAMLEISRDVVLRIVLRIEDKALLEEGRKVLAKLLHRAHPWIAFVVEFQSWWFPPWARYRRACREFSAFVARCLEERRVTGNESQDLLGLMLTGRYENGSAMRDDEIRDELFTILLAGHETTAVALAWALYELAQHPAVLGRLRDELDALEPDPDLIVKQAYLGAVCDETLRLHTILTEVARTAREPFELLGYSIPAGTGIGIGISAIHQDPSIYPEPDRFMPERFLGRAFSSCDFLPFGGGHRRCLGAVFSDYEMRIALATVVSRWEFELTGPEREVRHNIAMGPQHGVRLQVNGRRRRGA
jgi:cytochrome P450 family 110